MSNVVNIYTIRFLENDAVQQLSVLLLVAELTGLPTLTGGVFYRIVQWRGDGRRRRC